MKVADCTWHNRCKCTARLRRSVPLPSLWCIHLSHVHNVSPCRLPASWGRMDTRLWNDNLSRSRDCSRGVIPRRGSFSHSHATEAGIPWKGEGPPLSRVVHERLTVGYQWLTRSQRTRRPVLAFWIVSLKIEKVSSLDYSYWSWSFGQWVRCAIQNQYRVTRTKCSSDQMKKGLSSFTSIFVVLPSTSIILNWLTDMKDGIRLLSPSTQSSMVNWSLN